MTWGEPETAPLPTNPSLGTCPSLAAATTRPERKWTNIGRTEICNARERGGFENGSGPLSVWTKPVSSFRSAKKPAMRVRRLEVVHAALEPFRRRARVGRHYLLTLSLTDRLVFFPHSRLDNSRAGFCALSH